MDWFEKIKRYYNMSKYTKDEVKRFVKLGKITEEEYKEITGDDYIA